MSKRDPLRLTIPGNRRSVQGTPGSALAKTNLVSKSDKGKFLTFGEKAANAWGYGEGKDTTRKARVNREKKRNRIK
jgi:hypothetical protein